MFCAGLRRAQVLSDECELVSVRTVALPPNSGHARAIAARTFIELFDAIAEICVLYDPTECGASSRCWNYFKAAGYVSS